MGSAAKKLLSVVLYFAAMSLVVSVNGAWAQRAAGDIVLEPGASATVKYQMFCVQFGMPVSAGPVEFKGRSKHSAKHILAYAHSKGYVESNPVQVQLAIWRKTTGEWKAADHALAEDIFKKYVHFPAESEKGAVFMTDAIKAGTVKIQVMPVSPMKVANPPVDWAFMGEGQLTLTNTSKRRVTVRARDGFELAAPNQHMIGWISGMAR
jgi:hypothetical protein